MLTITVNYDRIPRSSRTHQARTGLGAWIDHQTENTLKLDEVYQSNTLPLALAAPSTESLCRQGAHTASPQVVAIVFVRDCLCHANARRWPGKGAVADVNPAR